MSISYKQCPNCGSKDTSKIIYGYPSHEIFIEAEAGKVKLGDCCILEINPTEKAACMSGIESKLSMMLTIK